MKCWPTILHSLEAHGTAAMVTVAHVEGSTPREAGARMIVTPDGYLGTIGGGTLEWKAMATAQKALGRPVGAAVTRHALGPDLGQCCGGRVTLVTEVFDASSLPQVRQWASREGEGPFEIAGRIPGLALVEHFGDLRRTLFLFGAGHVGRALVLALAPLPFALRWSDPRPNAFPRYVPETVTLHAGPAPEAILADAPAHSLAFVMSHSHALDLAITDAALRNPAIAHVGLIGSASKRARFEKRLLEAGVDAARVKALICPIGMGGITSKEPAAIAAATAAQCLMLHEALLAAAPAEPVLPSSKWGSP